jgi:hypothetical protein
MDQLRSHYPHIAKVIDRRRTFWNLFDRPCDELRKTNPMVQIVGQLDLACTAEGLAMVGVATSSCRIFSAADSGVPMWLNHS